MTTHCADSWEGKGIMCPSGNELLWGLDTYFIFQCCAFPLSRFCGCSFILLHCAMRIMQSLPANQVASLLNPLRTPLEHSSRSGPSEYVLAGKWSVFGVPWFLFSQCKNVLNYHEKMLLRATFRSPDSAGLG